MVTARLRHGGCRSGAQDGAGARGTGADNSRVGRSAVRLKPSQMPPSASGGARFVCQLVAVRSTMRLRSMKVKKLTVFTPGGHIRFEGTNLDIRIRTSDGAFALYIDSQGDERMFFGLPFEAVRDT